MWFLARAAGLGVKAGKYSDLAIHGTMPTMFHDTALPSALPSNLRKNWERQQFGPGVEDGLKVHPPIRSDSFLGPDSSLSLCEISLRNRGG